MTAGDGKKNIVDMTTAIIIILAAATGATALLLAGTRKKLEEKSLEHERLLKAIQSPICIVDADGRLKDIINRKYVKESAFDMDNTKDYDMTEMIADDEARLRFMKNLTSVIRQKEANYVNQDFIIKDTLGTEYRALLHIVFYKTGLAYVFINRIRLPK